jgi:hypothetical protein
MTGSLGDAVRDSTSRLLSLPEGEFPHAFNDALRELFQGFHIDSAAIRDNAGNQTPAFETIVSLTPILNAVADADSVACAACVCHTLDEETLREASDRIAQAKSLLKAPPRKEGQSNVTLGLIIAARSTMTLQQLANQVKTLNSSVHGEPRADMVTILTRGVVSYAVRLSGDSSIMDWLPPQPGPRSFVPPILLHIITTATTAHALNRTLGYLIGQIAFFAPDLPRPDMNAIIEGVPAVRNVVATYQPDLAGTYVEIDQPAPIMLPPYWVESPEGELLLKLFYQPWQDGGVIIGEGLLPLEGMLIFAPKPVSFVIAKRPGNRQVSAVLPLSVDDFNVFAGQIAKRSNLKVRLHQQQQFILAKMMDEGTSTPFIARLWFTPLTTMRDTVLGQDKAKIEEFDTIYGSLLNDLTTLRRIGKDTTDTWNAHQGKVTSGQIARNKGIHIEVDETIDEQMLHHIETVIKNAASTTKQLQQLTLLFGIDIGFVYQKDVGFKAGLEGLEQIDATLASYLAEARKWLEPVRLLRDDLEHKPFTANRITYNRDAAGYIVANEPHVMGLPVTTFIPVLLSRLNRYTEEVLMWCFQRVSPFLIGEIPVGQRDPDKPERFRFLYSPKAQPWVIIYSDDEFDSV